MEISSDNTGVSIPTASATPYFFPATNTFAASAVLSRFTPETSLFDTNILVYAYNADSEHHNACRSFLNRAIDETIAVCLAPQVLFEFFAVITNPKTMNQPISHAEALNELERLADIFPLITPPLDVHDRVINLMRQLGFGSRHIFDVVLAATMLGNDVTRIYTYDIDRFQKVPGITALMP